MKKCTQCGQEKNEGDFFKDRRLKWGLRSNCKVCQKSISDNWKERNPESVKKYRKKHYESHKHLWQQREANMSEEDREKKREYVRRYYEQFRDEINAKNRERYRNLSEEDKKRYSQKYYEDHKEEICERARKYYKNLPDDYKKKRVDTVREFRQKNREKIRAWSAVGNALVRGEMEKPSFCSSCASEEKLHAHHEDYSKPLDIQWLCHKCHMKIHADERRKDINNSKENS